MNIPAWALTVSFWLHMLATVSWIGGLATISLVVLPLARRSMEPDQFAKFLRAVNKRLDPLGWFGLAVLTVTGMFQMSANPNYEGFLAINNPWASAILIKHILFFGILATSAFQTWNLAPALERAALRRSKGIEDPQAETLLKREARLMFLSLVLGLLVLLFTALARIS